MFVPACLSRDEIKSHVGCEVPGRTEDRLPACRRKRASCPLRWQKLKRLTGEDACPPRQPGSLSPTHLPLCTLIRFDSFRDLDREFERSSRLEAGNFGRAPRVRTFDKRS